MPRQNRRDMTIGERVTRVEVTVDNHQETLENLETRKVDLTSFEPVKLIVYGMAGLALTAFMIGLLELLLKKG